MFPKPTDPELIEILEVTFAGLERSAPKQHRDKTPHCPSLLRFTAAAKSGWTAEENAHLANCRYCQLTWRAVLESSHKPAATTSTVVASQKDDLVSPAAEPASTVREFGVARTFSMAAGASCNSSSGESDEIPLDGDWTLRLSPKPGRADLVTLRLDGHPIPEDGSLQLCVANQPLPLVEPFDEFGYATITHEVRDHLVANRQQIKLRLSGQSD